MPLNIEFRLEHFVGFRKSRVDRAGADREMPCDIVGHCRMQYGSSRLYGTANVYDGFQRVGFDADCFQRIFGNVT